VSPSLGTPWSRSLGLDTPIVSAPMGGVAGGGFAHAVSQAGALGMIGMGSSGSAANLARQLAEFDAVRAADDVADAARRTRPFGIGMVHWGLERDPAMLEVALEARPTLVSVGFADRFDWVTGVHAGGALAATQVYTPAEALIAADAGVDVIVARGAEAGGHGDHRIGTLPLLDAVLDALDDRRGTPGAGPAVLAAGGIGSGRSLAAVLAAGADAAWIGTALTTARESLTPPGAVEVLLAAGGDDTATTTALDAALGLPWPERFPERVIRNAFVEEWGDRAQELRHEASHAELRARVAAANASGDHTLVPVDAGQGVGLLREVRPVAETIAEFTRDAAALLARRF
jgi:nitronate monooxygenase